MKCLYRRKRKHWIRLLIVAALALCLSLLFFPAAAAAEEESGQEALLGSVEEILAQLDTGALQDYLDSLTEEQRDFFGDSITDKIMSVISGDYWSD